MDADDKIVRLYLTAAGKSPFEEWFDALPDAIFKQRVLARIARLRSGNLGDWKSLGGGVFELRLDFGPGYRIYFGRRGNRIVILLVGGDKGSQRRDIRLAKEYWHDYEESEAAE